MSLCDWDKIRVARQRKRMDVLDWRMDAPDDLLLLFMSEERGYGRRR